MNLLLNKLREPSTWRGITFLLSAIGVNLRPDLTESIITLGIAAAGTIEVVRKERKTETK
jgi:hypothetical protein